MNYKDLSVCIPAYNEAEAIGPVLQRLRDHLPEVEIIVVDDGSLDDTLRIAQGVEGVRVLTHGHNMGYGAALKTAMRHSTRSTVAWYDSDGQHTPEDLENVARPVLLGEKDVVIGVRGSDSDAPSDRILGKVILKQIAQLVVRDKIPDLNSGMRCFRKDVICRYLHLLPDGFSASTTSTLLLMKRGYRIGYEHITARERAGKSTVKIIRDGWRTVSLMVRILILFEAFNAFALMSILQIVPGLIYGLIIALAVGRGVPVLAATVVLSGILTFFMGLICDQIVALRKERFEYMFPSPPAKVDYMGEEHNT